MGIDPHPMALVGAFSVIVKSSLHSKFDLNSQDHFIGDYRMCIV